MMLTVVSKLLGGKFTVALQSTYITIKKIVFVLHTFLMFNVQLSCVMYELNHCGWFNRFM